MPAYSSPPLISIITPCLNAVQYIAESIQSVLAQQYENFEHIVVDGGSCDGTQEVLALYPHLRWSSKADQGQSDAMNKGFAVSRGEVIVYLNADDYFEPNAFRAVQEPFSRGADFVVGRVRIIPYNGGPPWVDDPKVTLSEMLRWWTPADNYCCNPVGYFYRRAVQETVGPFNMEDHYTMDFEFLLEAARRYELTKIHDVLGCFRITPWTKTSKNFGNFETFRRFAKYSSYLEDSQRRLYLEELESILAQPRLVIP
jgi:glycosyltransferase involved in cell wall biosynthesis